MGERSQFAELRYGAIELVVTEIPEKDNSILKMRRNNKDGSSEINNSVKESLMILNVHILQLSDVAELRRDGSSELIPAQAPEIATKY